MSQRRLKMVRRSLIGSLTAVLAFSGCQGGAQPHSYQIAGGGTVGVYYSYGEYLAESLTQELADDFEVLETDGSVENLRLVGSGAALLGFAQGDTAADAARGVGAFDEPYDIHAVARLYDEYVHVVVAAESDAYELSDLVDRTVSLGAVGSGVQVIALRVLSAAGVEVDRVTNPELGIEDSIRALTENEIDGFFWVGGFPTPGFASLAEDVPIRLLPIGAEIVERVNAGHSGVYRLSEFPIGAYGIAEQTATATMTVPNYLITQPSAPDDLVHAITQRLFEARTDVSPQAPAAAYLDRRRAIFTYPIELHRGSSRFYIESRR